MKAHTSSPALLGANCISWRWPYQHLSPRPRALGGLCAPAHLEPHRTWLLLLAEVRCYFYDFCCQLTKVAQLACSTLSVSLETCLGTPEPACKKSGSPKAALLKDRVNNQLWNVEPFQLPGGPVLRDQAPDRDMAAAVTSPVPAIVWLPSQAKSTSWPTKMARENE